MTTLNLMNLRDELCDFLRRSDVLSTTIRGVTRTTSSYSVGVGGEATHTFTANIPVRDFKLLTVDSVNMYFLRDYTMNWNTGVLTWNTPLTVGQAVAYQIDWGAGDKIYPDLPRDDLTLTSYPRVGIELTSISTAPLGLGGTTHISDILITIFVWVPVNRDSGVNSSFGGIEDLEATMTLIRDAIRTNAKNFYSFSWITPSGTAPLFKGMNGKVLQHSADYQIKWRIE